MDIRKKVEWLLVTVLHVDAPYQRSLDANRAQIEIADQFDPNKFGLPVVSLRADGTYWVVDGQHRITAVRLMGWDDQKVPCEVIEGLTYEEEARLHVELQKARRRETALTQFNGMLEARDPMHVAINKMLVDRGLEITSTRGDGCVGAVNSVLSIYQRGGKELLARTLDTVIEAWGTTSDGFTSDILRAVAQVLAMHPNLNQPRLVKALASARPAEFVKKGLGSREATRAHLVNSIFVAIVATYNSLRGGTKLPRHLELLQPRAKTFFTTKSAANGRTLARARAVKAANVAAKKGAKK